MGCALILVLVGMPRVALVLLWFTRHGYVAEAFEQSAVWPILGFLFLPTTTLAFAYSMNSLGAAGEMTSFGWLLTAIGLIVDLGLHGWGGRRAAWRGDD
ncbi:MAG: hypothetical protein KTR31_00615 [Myxococcales bacterium]|nr:hypothetical protein [Myxococcales bacterium]